LGPPQQVIRSIADRGVPQRILRDYGEVACWIFAYSCAATLFHGI